MKKYAVLVCLLSGALYAIKWPHVATSLEVDDIRDEVPKVKWQQNSSDAMYAEVVSKRGDKRIVKQVISEDPDEQFLLINDFVASYMGEFVGIPVNNVCLVSFDNAPQGVPFEKRAATMHGFVPGISLDVEKPKFLQKKFTIQQCSEIRRTVVVECGLTKTVITSMSKHDDLPALVALDTLTNNHDRSEPNIFYDEATDRFWGIDQGAAFSGCSLVDRAITNLSACIQEEYRWTKAQKSSLVLYRYWLKRIYDAWPPELVRVFLEQGVLLAIVQENDRARIFNERFIVASHIYEYNYEKIPQLLALIDTITL